MKKTSKLFYFAILVMLCSIGLCACSDEPDYGLKPDKKSKTYFAIADIAEVEKVTAILESEGKSFIQPSIIGDNRFVLDKIYRKHLKAQFESDIYRGNVIVLPELMIKMEEGYDIQLVLDEYGEVLEFMKSIFGDVYKFKCNVPNSQQVLSLNKKINDMTSVEYCDPNMISSSFWFDD